MYSTAILSIFVTVVVMVQSAHAHHKKHEYTSAENIECKPHRKALQDTMAGIRCKPYPRYVSLKPMPSHEFHPSIVSVDRCDGHCPGNTCMPTETRMRKVPIKYSSRHIDGGSTGMCAFVEVEEHVSCKCMCIQKETDCNPELQVYMGYRCACACKDQEAKKQKCESKMGMLWNDDTCECSCTEMDLGCTSGQKWDRNVCACV